MSKKKLTFKKSKIAQLSHDQKYMIRGGDPTTNGDTTTDNTVTETENTGGNADDCWLWSWWPTLTSIK